MKMGCQPGMLASPVAHLIDCEVCGLNYAGLARLEPVAESHRKYGAPSHGLTTERETPVSALVAGRDQIGYIVGQKMTGLAIAKAREAGLALIGGKDTWYTSMLSFYAEQLYAEGRTSDISVRF